MTKLRYQVEIRAFDGTCKQREKIKWYYKPEGAHENIYKADVPANKVLKPEGAHVNVPLNRGLNWGEPPNQSVWMEISSNQRMKE